MITTRSEVSTRVNRSPVRAKGAVHVRHTMTERYVNLDQPAMMPHLVLCGKRQHESAARIVPREGAA